MDVREAMRYNVENGSKIQAICAPLEKFCGIKLIHYRRFYLGKGLISLFNDSAWMKVSFENRYWYSSVLSKKLEGLLTKKTLIYPWPQYPLDDPVYRGLYDHNLWNGITIYKNCSDCIESYAFATTRENTSAASFYISEEDKLERFILHFKSKVFSFLLGDVEKSIMIDCPLSLPSLPLQEKTEDLFLKETKISNFYIRKNGVDIKLTSREFECVALLALAKRPAEIASALKLSVRTVESYIDQARFKTGAYTTSQLINFYQDSKN